MGLRRPVASRIDGSRATVATDAVPAATGQDIFRAERVDTVKIIPAAGNRGHSGCVKHDVGLGTSSGYGLRIPNVAAYHLDAQRFQMRKGTACKPSHHVPSRQQLLDDVLGEEPAGAGNQRFHANLTRVC